MTDTAAEVDHTRYVELRLPLMASKLIQRILQLKDRRLYHITLMKVGPHLWSVSVDDAGSIEILR